MPLKPAPVKTMLMLTRRPGMTPEAFREAYEGRHSRLALRLFGHLWVAYRRSYLGPTSRFSDESGTPANAGGAATEAPFDAITEIVYRDRAALEESNRIAALPENQRLLAEDEASMFDRDRCFAAVVEEVEELLPATPRPAPPAPDPSGSA